MPDDTSSTPSSTRLPRSELAYVDYDWALDVKSCPCDVQFVEWLDESGTTDATIFHFGTGSHHYVGMECARPERRNSVLGITAAPGEHARFVDLVTNQPEVLRYYNAVFGDIYLLNRRLLPTFDVVTLFHLCEFRNWKHDSYGAMTDIELLRMLTEQTSDGGHILFYEGSLAFEWPQIGTRAVIEAWLVESGVREVGRFKSLLVYEKP